MGRAEALIALRQALSVDPELELLDEPGELQRHSRDAFEYSPVLTPRLEACRAELVVRPRTVDAVERLASACAVHQILRAHQFNGCTDVTCHGGWKPRRFLIAWLKQWPWTTHRPAFGIRQHRFLHQNRPSQIGGHVQGHFQVGSWSPPNGNVG